MAPDRGLAARQELIAAAAAFAVLGVGLVGIGSGFRNGDAAVYAAQGWAGDLLSRPTHALWIALNVALAPLAGPALPIVMDVVTAALAACTVLLVAAGTRARGGAAGVGALVCAAAVLPHASFAEVDVAWTCAVALAVVAPTRAAAVAYGTACALSPTAVLAGPWVWAVRDRDGLAVVAGGAVAVALLTVASAGDWWIGERGVLTAAPSLPGRTLGAWARGAPWLVVPLAMRAEPRTLWPLAASMPLLLAPPDVPTVLVPAMTLAVAAGCGWERGAHRVHGALVGLQLILATGQWRAAAATVRAEDAAIRVALAQLGPDDGLIAPWSWGARASVLRSGDPYGIPWRTPDGLLPRQRAAWCRRPLAAVAVLASDGTLSWPPPGAEGPGGSAAGPTGGADRIREDEKPPEGDFCEVEPMGLEPTTSRMPF